MTVSESVGPHRISNPRAATAPVRPISPRYVPHFAKGHAGLRHAEGAGVHSQEEYPPGAGRVPAQVRVMRPHRVLGRVVDMADGRAEGHAAHLAAEFTGGFDQALGNGHGSG